MGTLMTSIRATLVILSLFTLLLGIAYPLGMTKLATLLFPYQAGGSLIRDDKNTVIGSALIGQSFTDPKYFWGRPSSTGTMPYNAAASSGSNLSTSNPALRDAVRVRVAALKAADPENTMPIPVDLVTASASGLDPSISPASAYYQMDRIARIRHLNRSDLELIIKDNTIPRRFGVLGEPAVNVFAMNRALDTLVSIRTEE
ncbi:MAG: potassium-transporting ATPase subunit KdpC [Rickettsiales bacterium]